MEDGNNECPTEVLIDLQENNFMPPHVNYKGIQTPLDCYKSKKYLENKGNELSEIERGKYQCIMDMSPFRLKEECRIPVRTLNTNSEQISNQAGEDCPTAVLVDVPNSSLLCPKQYSAVNNNKYDCCQEHGLVTCKCLIQDVKGQQYNYHTGKKYSAIGNSDDPCDLITVNNQLSPERFHWKTPSPQSMSRISKEASKIIHNLNSSFLFDDDSPLCEEILPIPINFDYFDSDGNSDQGDLLSSTEGSCADKLSNYKSSVSIQTEKEVNNSEIISKEIVSISDSVEDNLRISEDQSDSSLATSELSNSHVNFSSEEGSNECTITSVDLKIQAHRHKNFNFSPSDEGANDVFIKNSVSSEDKENVLEKEYKEILPSKNLISIKTAQKNSVASKRKIENNRAIKKLSDVKHSTDSRNALKSNKENATPVKMGLKATVKESPATRKVQLKKTVLAMEPQIAPKMISRSESFQYNTTRESISNFSKPHSVKQDRSFSSNSEYKSSSSDVKHTFSQIKTPSRRFSIATPFKSASAKKPPVTPALPSFQKPSFPRYAPQSAGGTRFSFSKSWQQSNNVTNAKSLKYQNSSSSSTSSFSTINLSKLNKTALCQNISTISCQTSEKNAESTSSKKRFCSKLSLPSPLHPEQDRKLARALFPSNLKK